jgi:hypothetical protein
MYETHTNPADRWAHLLYRILSRLDGQCRLYGGQILYFSRPSRQALGPTHLPYIPGVYSGRAAVLTTQLRLRMAAQYLQPPRAFAVSYILVPTFSAEHTLAQEQHPRNVPVLASGHRDSSNTRAFLRCPGLCGPPSSQNVALFMCCKQDGNADLWMQWNFYYKITATVPTDSVRDSCKKRQSSTT